MIGTTGSGKTTFARALAERLGVPPVELDALFWQPGWVMSSADELRAKVEAVLDDRGWVVDGNYSTRLGSLVLEQVVTRSCSIRYAPIDVFAAREASS